MSRHSGVWLGAGMLGLLGAVSLQGCAHDGNSQVTESNGEGTRGLGDLSLGLQLPDGSTVDSATYTITRTSDLSFSQTGTLAIINGKATGTVTGLPAGTDYRIAISAARASDAGLPDCMGSASFTVVASSTTNVDVLLTCDEGGQADTTVTLNGAFNICPRVGSTTATPTSTAVGGSVALTSSASDKDHDPLSFLWASSSDGLFASGSSANTSYTCQTAGTKTLHVSVSDGPSRGCTRDSASITITCTASTIDAGSDAGALDAGTQSDAATGDGGVSSQPAYLLPSLTGVVIKPFFKAGDSVNNKPDGVTPYRMVGIPDGLGALDNGDGTFTLLSNHELSTGGTPVAPLGITRAHGSAGAFVSKWQVRKSDLTVLHGEDLIQTVQLFNKTTLTYAPGTVAFSRFCSADLAEQSAWYDAASSTGYQGRLFLNGEESGVEGRALAHELTGTSWELPRLGRQAWENLVASPKSGLKTVVMSQDDSSLTSSQVYAYVGTKTNTGSAIAKAGLSNGQLYGIKVTGLTAETNTTTLAPNTHFDLALLSGGNVEALTGAQLESAATAAGVTTFRRPEDGAWDPSNPNDYYFVTTSDVMTNSRLWRLRYNDVKNPETGGVIQMLLDGTEGHRMLDNITIDARGHLIALEDVGNDPRLGRVWRYTIATDSFVEIAAFNPAFFATGGASFLTQDEETSGVIDASALLGNGWYLLDVQAHYAADAELVEGGQYVAIFDPGSL